MAILETAHRLEEERLRWPRLMEELAKKSKSGMWITKVMMIPETQGLTDQSTPPKGGAAVMKFPQIEISGIFETKSEEADAEADAKVVDQFRKSLEEGGVLQKVVTIERETPERVEGKTEQVALKFSLRGEWPTMVSPDAKSKGKVQPK